MCSVAPSMDNEPLPSDGGNSVPRGRRWLDQVAISPTRLKRLLSKVERSKEELRPYKGGVVGDFARLLCCRDMETVKKLFGLGAVGDIPVDRINSIASDKLGRGNIGCHGRINTNKSYWPRQLEYLEFLQANDTYMSTIEDVAIESGRTQKEVSMLCNWTLGKISLVSAKGGVAYLESKKVAREMQNSDEDDLTTIEDVDDMFLEASLIEDTTKQRRRNKHVKEHLSETDSQKYEGALNELRKMQLFLLGMEGTMEKRLINFYDFEAMMKQISREHKQIELRHCSDKGHDGLHTLPSKQELERLYETWWNKAAKGRLHGHIGVMNICSFMDMKSTLARGDNEIMQQYCDKMLLVASDFSDHVSLQTPVPLHLYVTLAREGKPNKNNVKDYFVKLPSKHPCDCAVVMESVVMTYRHDLLGVQPPCFSKVEVNRATKTVDRPWYNAKFYCTLSSSSSNGNSLESRTEEPPIANGLYNPYQMSSLYKGWARDFTEHQISSLHVVHLPRVLESFLLSLHGCSRDETGQMGKWRCYQDSQSLSYDKLPNSNLLAKVSGYTDLSNYNPVWMTLNVPEFLISEVLQCFQGQLFLAEERCRRSKMLKDPFQAQIQEDTSAVQCLRYIESLRVIFALAAPFLRSKHPTHPLFQEHPLFAHSMWSRWEELQLKHCQVMELINGDLQGYGQGPIKFSILVQDDKWSIVSKPKNPLDRRFDAHARGLTAFINGENGIPPTVNELTERNLSDKNDSQEVLIESLHAKVSTIQKAILHQEERHCRLESMLMFTETTQPTTSITSHLPTPKPLTRSVQSKSKLEPKEAKQGNQKRQSEIMSIPPLSVLNGLPDSIGYIRNMWNNKWTHCSRENRPLKEILSCKKAKMNQTSSRGIANQLKRIRYLMIAVDILEHEGVVDAPSKLSSLFKSKGLHLNKGADQVLSELSKHGIVKAGKKITTEMVLKSSSYEKHRLHFMWSQLLK